MPSVCKINSNVTGTVVYAVRLLDANAVQFALSLSPEYSQYSYMNLQLGLQSTMPCSSLTGSYSGIYYMVTCYYTETI